VRVGLAVGAVDPVGSLVAAVDVRQNDGVLDLTDEGVALLAAEEFPAVVSAMVGGAAVFPVVVVIAGEVRVDASLREQGGQALVVRLDGSPAVVEKVRPAGVHVAAGGDALERADVAAVEDDSFTLEPLKVWKREIGAAIGREHV